MNAGYSRNEHGAIIKIAMDEISNYFDTVNEPEKQDTSALRVNAITMTFTHKG